MTRKKTPRPKTKILIGQVLVEEGEDFEIPSFSTEVARGIHPDNSHFRVFATLSDKTVHLASDSKPTRRVLLSALIEAMVNAKAKE